jgi:hypothetical protein
MKQILAAVCVTMLTVATPAMAWEMPAIPAGGASDEKTDAEVARLTKEQDILLQKVHASTVKLLDGVALLHKVAGDEAEVTRLQEVAKKLNESKGSELDRLKAADAEVKSVVAKLKDLKFPSRALSVDEKQWFHEAMTAAGASNLANVEVTRQAAVLGTEVTALTQGLMANPMKLMKAKQVGPGVAALNQLATGQVESGKAIADAMLRFAKSHRLEAPSVDELQKAAETLLEKR